MNNEPLPEAVEDVFSTPMGALWICGLLGLLCVNGYYWYKGHTPEPAGMFYLASILALFVWSLVLLPIDLVWFGRGRA